MGKFLDFYRTQLEDSILEKLWLGEEITDPFELEILEEARQAAEKKTRGKIYWDEEDRNYLYQIPASLWASAMRYRYENLIYETWLHTTSQQYYSNFEGNEEEKLAYAADQMSNHGAAERVAEWVKGPQDWDFIQLEKGQAKQLYFVKTGGTKLVNKLQILGLDPEFDKKDGEIQWKGYEPPAKMSNKAGTISARVNSWQKKSAEGWYSQDYDQHFDFEEENGTRILPADRISKMNDKQNPERRSALLRWVAHPEWLAAKGIKVDPQNYNEFVDKMMFEQAGDYRVYHYVKENGELGSTKDRIVVLYPTREVDQNGLKEYAEAKKESFSLPESQLEKIRKGANLDMKSLLQERTRLQNEAKRLENMPSGNNRTTGKLQKIATNKKYLFYNAKQIEIREILDQYRKNLIDHGMKLKPDDYVKLDRKKKEQYDDMLEVLRDNGVFGSNDNENLKRIVQNTLTVSPEEIYAPMLSNEQLAKFLGIYEEPDWKKQVNEFRNQATARTKGFQSSKETGMWINYHTPSVHDNPEFTDRWEREPVHYKAFIFNGNKYVRNRPLVNHPWDETSTQDSPAYWGLNKAEADSKVTKTKDTEESISKKETMLVTDVNQKIIANLGKPVFEDYFRAYDAWKKSKSEETEADLRMAYETAAAEVKSLAEQFMRSDRQKGKNQEKHRRKVHSERGQEFTSQINREIAAAQNRKVSDDDNETPEIPVAKGELLSTEEALRKVRKILGLIDASIPAADFAANEQVRWIDEGQQIPDPQDKIREDYTNRFYSILYHIRHHQISYTPNDDKRDLNVNVEDVINNEMEEVARRRKETLPQNLAASPMVKLYIKDTKKYKEQKMKNAAAVHGIDLEQIKSNKFELDRIIRYAYVAAKNELHGAINTGLKRMKITHSPVDPYQEAKDKLDEIFRDAEPSNTNVVKPVSPPVQTFRGLGSKVRPRPVAQQTPLIQPETLPKTPPLVPPSPVQSKTGPRVQRELPF